jgi:hypothetical protein
MQFSEQIRLHKMCSLRRGFCHVISKQSRVNVHNIGIITFGGGGAVTRCGSGSSSRSRSDGSKRDVKHGEFSKKNFEQTE